MNMNWRAVLLAVAFSTTVAAALTGASLSGQTKETSLDDTCTHAAWPLIPAQCLEGAQDREIRIVTTRSAVETIPVVPQATLALN